MALRFTDSARERLSSGSRRLSGAVRARLGRDRKSTAASGEARPEPEPPSNGRSVSAGDSEGSRTQLRDRLSPPSGALRPSTWGRGAKLAAAIGATLLVGGIGLALGLLIADDEQGAPAPAPTVVVEPEPEPEPAAAEEIGFPGFATLNTTRVGGSDPIADAAAVALASYPSVGGVGGPDAVVLAPAESWQAALAATSLVADPIAAPILLGSPDEIPGFTAEALEGLAPGGIEDADGTQLIAVGDVTTPAGLETVGIDAGSPAELAAAIDRRRPRLGGVKEPQSILVVSAEDAGMAMPAAAWAARSGDPIVFADGDEVPDATLEVIDRHPEARVYVLGPESAIGARALRKLERAAGSAVRIEGPDPVRNAIAFARFLDGPFGWNINDPGHGFSLANTDRPADAAAAAPLAAGGKPGPLLLTDDVDELPRPLRNFFLDTKPGFTDDPSRALFNHVWLLGDTTAISLAVQAQIDELVELQPVSRGSGVPDFGPAPGAAEEEADPSRDR